MSDTQTSLLTELWGLITLEDALENVMGTVRLYPVNAPPDAPMPYIVHRVDIAPSEPWPMRSATYIMDLWSSQPNVEEVLSMRSILIGLLDGLMFSNSEVTALRVSLQTEGFIPEMGDQHMYHYVLQFNLRFYRSGEVAKIIAR